MQTVITKQYGYGEPGLKLVVSLDQLEAATAAERMPSLEMSPFGEFAVDETGTNIRMKFLAVDEPSDECFDVKSDQIEVKLGPDTRGRATRSLHWLSKQKGKSFDYVDLVDSEKEAFSFIVRLVPAGR